MFKLPFILFICFVLLLLLYRNGLLFEFLYALPVSPFEISAIRESSKTIALPKSDCDQSIWNRVYLPSRLLIIQPCIEIAGTIGKIDMESDGDNHIYFKPDLSSPSLLNMFNKFLAGSNIIAEVVCLKRDNIEGGAKKSCAGYENKINVPKTETHVKMFGSLVLDKDVGWIEIHPVTAIIAD